MAKSEQSAYEGWSQLRIVLLGGRNSGKSSVGNLILGKEEFAARERTSCCRRLGVVDKRWLTVVDTPGWWCDFGADSSCRLVKREIASSVSLCPPGPHALLITVRAGSAFSDRRRRALEEHVTLLGDEVWDYCIVVFTFADRLQRAWSKSFEETGGAALRWLIEKCGQRCHSVVLCDEADVNGLLAKIQTLVAGNGDRAFQMEAKILEATEEEKRRVEKRAQLRCSTMKQHRSLIRETLRSVTSIRIVLLGAKGSGKTSTLNTILGRQSSRPPGRTVRASAAKGVVFGRQVAAVDTPGWWMNYFSEESSLFDRREMVLSLAMCPPGPHIFLLVVRVDRAFTDTYRRAVQEHLELISEHIWGHVILLFSFGDWLVGTSTEQYIESEGGPLLWLTEKCCNRYHVLNNRAKGDGFQVRELIGKMEEIICGCTDARHYEIERKELQELQRRMKEEEERAKDRRRRKEKQRERLKSETEMLPPLKELRLFLAGGRRVGKSSCGNTILSREAFDTNAKTTSCAEERSQIGNKTVSVLDTPGGFAMTPDLLVTPSAVLLVVNVSSSFTELHKEAAERQLEAGGAQLWDRAMVVFSCGDQLGDTSVEQRIECEGVALQRLLERCGNRYHVLDNRNWGDGGQVRELVELVEEMLAPQRLAALHRDGHVWKRACSSEEACENLWPKQSSGWKPPSDPAESATSVRSPEGSNALQVAARPERRVRLMFLDRNGFTFHPASMLKPTLRWSMPDLPVGFASPTYDIPAGRQAVHLLSGRAQPGSPQEDCGVQSLRLPVQGEQTLWRVSEPGGLQALAGQWGCSSLEELEAFIDSYLETVRDHTVDSFWAPEHDCSTAARDTVFTEGGGQEVFLSIDRKLSKLEDIHRDLSALIKTLVSGKKCEGCSK